MKRIHITPRQREVVAIAGAGLLNRAVSGAMPVGNARILWHVLSIGNELRAMRPLRRQEVQHEGVSDSSSLSRGPDWDRRYRRSLMMKLLLEMLPESARLSMWHALQDRYAPDGWIVATTTTTSGGTVTDDPPVAPV